MRFNSVFKGLISRFWHWDTRKSYNDFRNCAKLFLFLNSKEEMLRQSNSNCVEPIRFWKSQRLSFRKKFCSCYVTRRFITLFTEVPTWTQSKLYCLKVHSYTNFPFTPPQLVSVLFSKNSLVPVFLLFHACYIFHFPHLPWLHHSIWLDCIEKTLFCFKM